MTSNCAAMPLTAQALTCKDEWLAGVDRLVGLLAQGRGQLNITYRCSSFAPIANDRVLVVKDLVGATLAAGRP